VTKNTIAPVIKNVNLASVKKMRIINYIANMALFLPVSSKANVTVSCNYSMKSTLSKNISIVSVKTIINKKDTYRFYIQGAAHGNEIATTEFINWLIDRVKNKRSLLNKLPFNFIIDFVPIVNPDSHGKKRNNPNDVDLNRNFGVLWEYNKNSGHKPFSEAETLSVAFMFEKYDYTMAIDIHGYIEWLVVPSAIGQSVRYNKLLDIVNKIKGDHRVVTSSSLGHGGSFEDWVFWSKGVYAFCLEMVSNNEGLFTKYEKIIYKAFLNSV
jgi:hypothetical protein